MIETAHRCDGWVLSINGRMRCIECGRPRGEVEDMSEVEAPGLTPAELATVARFGLDRPEPHTPSLDELMWAWVDAAPFGSGPTVTDDRKAGFRRAVEGVRAEAAGGVAAALAMVPEARAALDAVGDGDWSPQDLLLARLLDALGDEPSPAEHAATSDEAVETIGLGPLETVSIALHKTPGGWTLMAREQVGAQVAAFGPLKCPSVETALAAVGSWLDGDSDE